MSKSSDEAEYLCSHYAKRWLKLGGETCGSVCSPKEEAELGWNGTTARRDFIYFLNYF